MKVLVRLYNVTILQVTEEADIVGVVWLELSLRKTGPLLVYKRQFIILLVTFRFTTYKQHFFEVEIDLVVTEGTLGAVYIAIIGAGNPIPVEIELNNAAY